MGSVGWPDVAMALIEFAKADTVKFLLTVPLTGIVILAGAFLFLRIVVIRPISMTKATYDRIRASHRDRDRELPLK
jgi:hypothetical protein